MNKKTSVMIIVFGTLLAIAVPCRAQAESCSPAVAEQAVINASEIIKHLGVKAAKEVITEKDARFRCGPYSVKVLDYKGTWVIDPEGTNVGRTVASFGDGAATNFMNALIRAAVAKRGAVESHLTTDTEHNKKINKILSYIDIPKHKVIVYGAFILD
ncbi:MAG: hypothetical protein HQL87_16735 [Magnetococcales bacterium]|nr:hypothetical protein [Magnetococcales bacterium]